MKVILKFSSLFFFLLQAPVTHQLDKGKNLAFGKPAYQPSTVLKGVASNAVDGYRHPDFSKNSCVHTDNRYEPWWYVDLQGVFYVTSVVITNRRDCCYRRLTNFEIKVGYDDMEGGVRNHRCAPRFYKPVDPGTSVEIICDKLSDGRYVTVVIPESFGILNFCEVEVYGKKPSMVLPLKFFSNGIAEAVRNSYSKLFDPDREQEIKFTGLSFSLYSIVTGRRFLYRNFNTYGDATTRERLPNFLKTIPNDTVVCMLMFRTGERYYRESLPYLEELLGEPITADLSHGESWALLGYKGIHSPIPHWRQSVRRKMGDGPSVMEKLVTLRQAPNGAASNIEIVSRDGSAIKLTWTRPDDFLTDDDYPFDYHVCIRNVDINFCNLVVKKLHYTFTGLRPLTNYAISIQPRSASMSGDLTNLAATTVEPDAFLIKVRIISRVQEDAFYRLPVQAYSSIIVAGVSYNFNQHGHNFVVLDAITGAVEEIKSFNTHEDPDSASKMASFFTSLPDKVIILMAVYFRGHVHYRHASAILSTDCPKLPSSLNEEQSNALICLKGLGSPAWIDSKVSTFTQGPAVLEKDILLPKDLSTFPAITQTFASSSSLSIEWTVPATDKFTGEISKYEICYSGDFGVNKSVEVGATQSNSQYTITELHPYTEYEVKVRAGAVLGYGPFSAVVKKTTLEEAPSGPPQELSVDHVNQSSIHVSWSLPARIDRNGVISGFSVCFRKASPDALCLYNVNNTAEQTLVVFAGLQPFTEYMVQVKARSRVGYGPPGNITQITATAAPSGPPTQLNVNFANSTTFIISWAPPEEVLRNGIIQKYKVCVRGNTHLDPCDEKTFSASQMNYTVTGLKPYTVYDIVVAAATSAGFGPDAITFNRTSESAPSSPPLNFSVNFVNSSFLNVTWTAPKSENHNGILTKYLLTILPDASSLLSKRKMILGSEQISYLATDLTPFVNYVMGIRAGTEAGFGPAAVINAQTSMAAPSGPPTMVKVTNVTSTTFQISWSPPTRINRNGFIVSYYLCIREFGVLHACNDTRNTSDRWYLFTGLNPEKEYLVEIKAATMVGCGPSAFVQKMAGECDNALVNDPNKIANFQMTASGHLGHGHEPYQARFNNLKTWCGDSSNTGTYLQIDLGGSLRILAIGTQGDMRHFQSWVKLYNVLYSTNAASWTTITVSGDEEIPGNTGEGTVKHYLDEPVVARYVRFKVLTFAGLNPCMRVEIFGCAPAVSPHTITVVSWNATSVEVSWEPSKQADANGEIQGYVICPRESSLVTCKHNKTYAGRDDSSMVITGLKPYTYYSLGISSYNIAGEGPSIYVQQQTAQAPPSGSPETIEVLGTTTNSIRVFWSQVREEDKHGIIVKYSLCFQEYELEHACTGFREISSASRKYLLSGLRPFTEYLILIRAATIAGWGPAASHRHRTLSAPPSGPPTSVSIKHLGPTVLEVTWSPPEVEKRNGVIAGYRLCAQDASEAGPCHNQIVVTGADQLHAIAGLKPYTMYAVSVEARTAAGYGPSSVFHHRTAESVPSGVPAEISVTFVNETAITVKWDKPDDREINGILASYKAILHEQLANGNLKVISNKTVSYLSSTLTFSQLKVKTEYIIEVKAGTVKGFGPPSVVHQRTAGQADVTYVKKSNKAYLALAKAGITAGALSVLAMIGFFIFVSLLVTGYVPYSSPWRKRRKRLWREKIKKQQKERERMSGEEYSEFGSSDSNSSGQSESSEDESDYSGKETKASKKKQKSRKRSVSQNENKSLNSQDIAQEALDSPRESLHEGIHAGTSMNVCEPEDAYGAQLEDIYGRVVMDAYVRSAMNIYAAAQQEGIHGESPYGPRPEDIYGEIPRDINGLRPENIHGETPGDIYRTRSEDVHRGTPGDIYGSTLQFLSPTPNQLLHTSLSGNHLGLMPGTQQSQFLNQTLSANHFGIMTEPEDEVTAENLYGMVARRSIYG